MTRMTMDDPETNPGRQPRVGESGAPVGSILSIVLAVVAVIVGFVILKQINDDDDNGSSDPAIVTPNTSQNSGNNGDDSPDTTEGSEGSTATTEAPGPVLVFKGARVVVANAGGPGGSAADMTDKLAFVGFTMGDATNAGGDEAQIDKTKIYFKQGNAKAQDVAETASLFLGDAPVSAMPSEVPTEDGELDGAVLVMLGPDRAMKKLTTPDANATPPTNAPTATTAGD